MPLRSETLPDGIIRLNKLVAKLNAAPKLHLPGVKALRISFSGQTMNHIGARQFVKEELPRIRWVNPKLTIELQKVRKTPAEKWRPEMEVELENGAVRKVDMNNKYSSSITEELMEMIGGDVWKKHAFASRNAGIPVLPGADKHELQHQAYVEKLKEKGITEENLPTLQEYLKANPAKAAELAEKKPITRKASSSTTTEKPKVAA